MLTEIREKSQGLFAQIILMGVCVLFALWGIQNYLDNGKEAAIASVGDKDFFQRDVNKAYEQYSGQLQGMGLDEQTLRMQALQKLIKDEVLLQHVHNEGLIATDDAVREFIQNLEYFQTDGAFDDKKYKAFLSSQRLPTAEFINRIRNALVMEQFQHSVVDSSFATQYDVESFFKIQNQKRDIDTLTVALQTVTEQPTDKDIEVYYQEHKDAYKTPEQVSVEYVELLLADFAKDVAVSDDKLKAYYDEQKDAYTLPERRKISHILFATNAKQDDQAALAKAQKAQEELAAGKSFSNVAQQMSDDSYTAKQGGDLGLFNAGSMEKDFEDAINKLKQGEVSPPVKSKFGYHLIKVTELVPSEIKPFDSVKDELTKAYQKSQAENAFYEAGGKLTEISYENSDNLQATADALKLTIKKSTLFTKDKGEGIASEDKIRGEAFSDEVLQGNNSKAIELNTDHLVVLRLQERKPAALRDLAEVKADIVATLLKDKAKQLTLDKAKTIKASLQAGATLQSVASDNKVEVKKFVGLTRSKPELPEAVMDTIFKAAKPMGDKPSIFIAALPTGEQIVVSLNKVTEGVMSEDDKKRMDLAKKNIAAAFGQIEFDAVLKSLQARADIEINVKKVQAAQPQ